MINTFIDKHGPLLFDGAFATYYAIKYKDEGCCELANIQYPERVKEIHEEYIQAGCHAIKTNTFNANTQHLDCHEEEIAVILRQGYRLAKACATGKDVFVFADMGPLLEQKNVRFFDHYKAMVDIFIEEGATNFLFETLSNTQGIVEICEYIRQRVEHSYLIVSFAITADGYTRQGIPSHKLLDEVREHVDAFGFNCVCGPMHLHRLVKSMKIDGPLISIMPNAGYPTIVHDRVYFRDNSDYFADVMNKIVKEGARIIGGCCGTTPTFIKKVRKALGENLPTQQDQDIQVEQLTKIIAQKNKIQQKLQAGKKIIAVEFDPPNNCDIQRFMENAECLMEQGIDAITIADCPIARARVDSSLLAAKLHREMGVDVIPHMTCRDRNINATKALLYGLQIEDIHNVLVVTGDPISQADKNEIKGVFNFNSQILAGYIKDLNETIFPHPFQVYGALNINAVNFKAELAKAKKKEAQGVSAFLTQPVLSDHAMDNLILAKQTLTSYILGGIIPIVSHRNALYMNNEISGIEIDEQYISQYIDTTREEASKLAVSISCEIADAIAPIVDGFYLITPFNRVDIITQIAAHIQDKLS